MIIQQADLLKGLSRDFIKEFMDTTTKDSHKEGDNLFREGDSANRFYILLKGRIRLTIGKAGQMVYHVDRPGEAFGWSSLVDREAYSASAECMVETKLLRIDRVEFQRIVENDPSNGMIFFRRLAEAVGERLINSYNALLLAQPSEDHRTYGDSSTLEEMSEGPTA
jgi:CRP-like cAMP-binding protein